MRVRIQTSSSNLLCCSVQVPSTHGKGKPEYCLVTPLQRNTLSNQITGHPVTLGDWKHSGSKGKKDIRQTIFTNWRQTRANWSGFPVIKGSSTSFIILRELKKRNNQPNKTQQLNIILSENKSPHCYRSKNKIFKILPKHFLDILHRTYGTNRNRLEKEKKEKQNRKYIYFHSVMSNI